MASTSTNTSAPPAIRTLSLASTSAAPSAKTSNYVPFSTLRSKVLLLEASLYLFEHGTTSQAFTPAGSDFRAADANRQALRMLQLQARNIGALLDVLELLQLLLLRKMLPEPLRIQVPLRQHA